MWIARITTKLGDKIEKIEIKAKHTERLWDRINYIGMCKEIIEIHIFKEV